MKPASKRILGALGLFLVTAGLFAASASRDRIFTIVPAGDPAYTQLQSLEQDGLLAKGDSQGPLTRFEMAQRIFKAASSYKEIVVAQADMDLPPPPPDAGSSAPPPPGDNAASSTTAPASSDTGTLSSASGPVPIWKDPQKMAEAERNLRSLQEAYDYELKLVHDQKNDLVDKVSKAEADQFDLWKSVKGITEYPSIAVHGVGRAFGYGEQSYGAVVEPTLRQGFRQGSAYLDLEPTGSISKEARWKAIFRFGTSYLPIVGTNSSTTSDLLTIRWVGAEFNPPFLSASLGDFYESYTPLTLWHRDSADLFYKTEQQIRWDRIRQSETFMDQAPAWPFRGLRLGTAIGWPDSNLLESFKASSFVHMIRLGFNDASGGWYFGPNLFTDLIVGGSGEVKSKKWYVGGTSWQLTADTYGVILDEPLDSTLPGSPYGQYNSTTWAHQYLIGSLDPTLRVGLGDDLYLGLKYNGAFSSYQDDKRNPNSIISDYAMMMGGFVQVGGSRIGFTYMNVGPYYYSPLAQSRDDKPGLDFTNYFAAKGPLVPSSLFGPQFFQVPYQDQFFLTKVPRAGAIYGFYDRTMDNTFPYGLATPNREGIGLDVDIQALANKSLKFRGAAYFVSEISGNLVVNSGGTGFTGLDTTGGQIPLRKFTYINLGPSMDLGPNIGLSTPFEIGTNVRYESTNSVAGTLNSFWILGGVRAGLLPGWEIAGSYGTRSFSGTEEGYQGLPVARYSYLFDSTDLGSYSTFNVSGSEQEYILTTTVETGRNSKLHFDYGMAWGNETPYYGTMAGTSYKQSLELSYEIFF